MITKAKNTFLCFLIIQLLLIMSSVSYAKGCPNNWKRPSTQTMELGTIYATFAKYENGERYLSMKTGKLKIDVYYLRDALLVKGMDDIEINYDSILGLPVMFALPMQVVSRAVPKGFCNVTEKISFSIMGAEGEISPSAQELLNYKFTSIDKKSAKVKINYFSGTMGFTPPPNAPSEDIDVRGYKLVGQNKPYPVIGSKDLPVTTLGALRRALAEKKNSSTP